MANPLQELETRLLALVQEAAPAALDRLEEALQEGRLYPDLSLSAADQVLGRSVVPGYLLAPFLRAWARVGTSTLSPQSIALALGVARRMKQRMEESAPRILPVWTGPYPPEGVTARQTLHVMEEMIAGARKRILLVGYTLTRGNEASTRLVQAMVDAVVHRQVHVAIALHDDGVNHRNLLDLWPKGVRLQLLKWVGRPTDPKASLHAKLLVVDGRDLLVTSANLTHLGLEKNIEFGVRIQGNFAFQVDRHFAALVRQGILVEYRE